MVYMYHSFLIHSSADGYLGCFHVLAIINSVAMNIGVYMSLSDLVPCMQNRKRDTDVQNRLSDSVEEGEGGMLREKSIETCI